MTHHHHRRLNSQVWYLYAEYFYYVRILSSEAYKQWRTLYNSQGLNGVNDVKAYLFILLWIFYALQSDISDLHPA